MSVRLIAMSGTVTAVLASTDQTPDTCNVDTGGDDGHRGVFVGAYPNTQQGDRVVIQGVDGGAFWVAANFTRAAAAAPTIPQLRFGNPSDLPPGAILTGALYKLPDPDFGLFAVYSTPPVPPPAPAGTVTVPPGVSSTYDNRNQWDSRNDVRQGSPGQDGIASSTGCYFYDLSSVAGHTITGLAVHIQRRARGGAGGAVTLHFGLFSGSTGSGAPTVLAATEGPNLSTSQVADCPLPADWGQRLADGTATGVCVFSSSTSDYLVCDGVGDDPRNAPGHPPMAPGALTFTLG